MWKKHNQNPLQERVGDCTVRAVSKALGIDWFEAYVGLCVTGMLACDMPSANRVWGEYLRQKGFRRAVPPCECTVKEFCADHPTGIYVLALDRHVVVAIGGAYYDTWDSGNEPVIYVWERKDESE